MSLMKMMTKVAIGFAVAKGMQKVQQSGGLGKVMEGLTQAGSGGGAGGGLGDIMGQLGGGAGGTTSAAGGGGLGDIMGGLAGGAGGAGGGLGDILGKLGGAGGGAAGGLGGLGGLLGGLAQANGGSGGGLEGLLNADNPPEEPAEDEMASLMIRAMVMSARSDGELDATEKENLIGTLGQDAGPDEMAVVQAALAEPIDPAAIARDTPQGMETQVYSMSVMAISPDNQAEAQYLHGLATALGIGQQTVNEIHDNFGAPRLYS